MFRDGEKISTIDNRNVSIGEIIKLMLGNKTYSNYKRQHSYATDEVLMEVKHVSTAKLKDVSLHIKKGEVLGIAGVVGAGKTEVAKAIFGLDKISQGNIVFENKKYNPLPQNAIADGLALVPEERQAEGLIPDFPNSSNITVTYLKKWCRGGGHL